ncbi:MAG: hypothetical protein JXA42_05250 [Anaerolineales bacterium]|nr:hypothetical protein [Anaerolineales bacterium]
MNIRIDYSRLLRLAIIVFLLTQGLPLATVAGQPAPVDRERLFNEADADVVSQENLGIEPGDIDIDGPTTVTIGQTETFTATVSPDDATLPITFKWQATGMLPIERPVDGYVDSLNLTWSVTGTKTISVTATNVDGAFAVGYSVQVEPEAMPDLQIADIYNRAHSLGYQLYNSGNLTVTGQYTTEIIVDSGGPFYDSFDLALGPGERIDRLMVGTIWVCSGSSDTIQVKADSDNVVDESNEKNNARKESWTCDQTAPIITDGPNVIDIVENKVTITWETDEAANSRITYDIRPEQYGEVYYDGTLLTDHQAVLNDLEPGTVYQYKVWSTDGQGNMIVDGPHYFETESPAPSLPPAAAPITVTLLADGSLNVTLPLTQSEQVDRVEFYWNDELIGIDYTGQEGEITLRDATTGRSVQATANKFSVDFVPSVLKEYPSAEFFYADEHNVRAKVFQSGVGTFVQYGVAYNPPKEIVPEPQVILAFPPDGFTLMINSTEAPAGTEIDAIATAMRYIWQCEYGQGDDCSAVARAVDSVSFYGSWDSQNPLCVSYPEDDLQIFHTCHVDLSGLPVGTYTIEANMVDNLGVLYRDRHTIILGQSEANLSVVKTIERNGNRFSVTLDISNSSNASAAALIYTIETDDNGFILLEKETADYTIFSDYIRSSRTTHSVIDLHRSGFNYLALAPGDSYQISYDMIPIMYEVPDYDDYGNTTNAVVTYYASSALHESTFTLNNNIVKDGSNSLLTFPEVNNAFASSDYLIITNPNNIYWHNNLADYNHLLSTMAHLAYLKQGVIGFITSECPDVLNVLLEEDSGEYRWANRMNPEFNEDSQGYVLLVGENDIVASYTKHDFLVAVESDLDYIYKDVHLTDNPYAHTHGNGRPDLIVGRIIGNNADKLANVIQTSINNYLGVPGYGYDWSDATLTSDFEGRFVNSLNEIDTRLINKGFTTRKFHVRDTVTKNSFPFDFMQHNGLATEDIDGDGYDEIFIADRDDHIYILNRFGNVVGGFGLDDFEEGDGFAVGDVDNDNEIEIVLGDRGNYIYVYSLDGTREHRFSKNYEEFDGLLVGNVTGDLKEEILMFDRGNKLYIFDEVGTKLAEFPFDFEMHDGLAIGNLTGTSAEEFVLGDRSHDRLVVYSVFGLVLNEISVLEDQNFEAGDGLAAGDVAGDGYAEVVFGDRADWIAIFEFNQTELKLQSIRSIPFDFEEYDGLVVGDVYSPDLGDDILVADRANLFLVPDRFHPEKTYSSMFNNDIYNTDLLLYRGHGGTTNWHVLRSTGSFDTSLGVKRNYFPIYFNNTAPFVWGLTCLSGNYSGYGISEAFLDSGAAVYIGATEVSYTGENSSAGRWFFSHWEPTETLGKAFIDLERNKYSGDDIREGWAYFVHVFNFYGDPKFGNNSPTLVLRDPELADRTATAATVFTPTEQLVVQVPAYEIVQEGDWDAATIPDGDIRDEQGAYQVPYYRVLRSVPAGQQVQEVVLEERKEFEITSNIYLTVSQGQPDCCVIPTFRAAHISRSPDVEEAWTPALDQVYDWEVLQDSDGASTLVINMYPFYYNSETTSVRFHDTYTFTIESITTTLSTADVDVGQEAYAQGEMVDVSVRAENAGDAQDLILEATIRKGTNDKIVESLLYQSLREVAGDSCFDVLWDSTGYDTGSYYARVDLLDKEGQVVNTALQEFQLGILSGEVTSLTATPEEFDVGDMVDISMTFANSGTIPITGTVVLEIQTNDGLSTTMTYTETIVDLQPLQGVQIDTQWDTSAAMAGDYRLVGYVSYEGQTTGIRIVLLMGKGESMIYLPLVIRQ